MTQEKFNNYKQIIKGNNLDNVILYWDDKFKYMTDCIKQNLLHIAVKYDVKLEIIEFLIKKIEINEVDRIGQTPLYIATFYGHTDIAKLLIHSGADLSIQNKFGQTPLYRAADGGRTDIAKLLIQNGADLSIKDNNGQTPLHLAADEGRTEIAKLLIQNGADLSIKDNDGKTPLHNATFYGHTDIAKLLIQNGADLSIKDDFGQTPLQLAKERGHTKCASVLKKVASKSTKFTSKQRKEVSLPAVSKPAKITEQKKD